MDNIICQRVSTSVTGSASGFDLPLLAPSTNGKRRVVLGVLLAANRAAITTDGLVQLQISDTGDPSKTLAAANLGGPNGSTHPAMMLTFPGGVDIDTAGIYAYGTTEHWPSTTALYMMLYYYEMG
jgi:hypothetical protein